MKKTLDYFAGKKNFLKRIFLLFNRLERIGRNQQFLQMKHTKKKKRGMRKILLTNQRERIFEMVVGS